MSSQAQQFISIPSKQSHLHSPGFFQPPHHPHCRCLNFNALSKTKPLPPQPSQNRVPTPASCWQHTLPHQCCLGPDPESTCWVSYSHPPEHSKPQPPLDQCRDILIQTPECRHPVLRSPGPWWLMPCMVRNVSVHRHKSSEPGARLR